MPHADTIPNIDLAPFFTDPTWMTRNVRYPVSEAEENQFGAAPLSRLQFPRPAADLEYCGAGSDDSERRLDQRRLCR